MGESKVRKVAALAIAVALVFFPVIAFATPFHVETRVLAGQTWVAKAILDYDGAQVYGVLAGEYPGSLKAPGKTTCYFQVFQVKGQARSAQEETKFAGSLGLEIDVLVPDTGTFWVTTPKNGKGDFGWAPVKLDEKGELRFPEGYAVKPIGRTDDGMLRLSVLSWPEGDPCFSW